MHGSIWCQRRQILGIEGKDPLDVDVATTYLFVSQQKYRYPLHSIICDDGVQLIKRLTQSLGVIAVHYVHEPV